MVKFDLWTRRKSLGLDRSSGGSSNCGQAVTVVVADSLYSSSSTGSGSELDSTTTHLPASSPPYLPHPPTHSTATVAPLDLTTSTDSLSRQSSEAYIKNNNNNNDNSQKNDNKYDSNIHEQEHQHGNFENNANDGNNSAAVAFSQTRQQHEHTEIITNFKQITKTSSAKSSYKWKHGKITTTATKTDFATGAVTHPVRQNLLEPLQIQIPTCLSHLEEATTIMDTQPFALGGGGAAAASTSFIATTCKQQTTSTKSTIIHSSLPPSQSSLVVAAATPSTSRHISYQQSNNEQKATIFHHHHHQQQHHRHEEQQMSSTTGLDLSTASCRRTIPITSWTSTAATMSYKHAQYMKYGASCAKNNSNAETTASSTVTAAHVVQIKREPCLNTDVSTYFNAPTLSATAVPGLRQTAVVKFERHNHNTNNSNNTSSSNNNSKEANSNLTTITNNSVTIMDGTNIASGQTTIPVGIAVARQRLQETAQATSPILKPDISRYGIGLSDLTGCTTPSLSQSMYFTGTNSTMFPVSDAMAMGVSTRSTPTLWQYPSATLPIEPMLPSPVGYQLMREPSTGQLVMLPSTTTIEKVLCMSYASEPFQPTVVWPQYTQATAAYTSQPSQLMLPPQMSQALQPPPLAPLQLLGPDYLASATLHQHTQTQHTRLVALTADGKRKTANGMPLPLTSHAYVKIEDMSTGGMSPHQSLFEPEKSLQSQFVAAMSGNDIPAQIFYQHPANLIQIAPQNQTTTIMESSMTDCRQVHSPVVHHPCLTPPPEDQQDPEEEHQTMLPEVQDANIQTSPVMSEEENSNCTDDGMQEAPESTCQENEINTNTNEADDTPNMCMSSTFLNHHSEDANSCIVSSSETIVPTIKPKVEVVTPEKCVIFPSRFTSSLHESISNSTLPTSTATGCDVSGLELLSRSIEVFHKKTTTAAVTTTTSTNIKLEPLSPQPEPSCLSPNGPITHLQQQLQLQQPHQPTHSDLGGLNLLCALAEQRFQEEVGSDANNCKKSSPSSSSMDDFESRKRKHKHSGSKKSSKRSKRDRSDDRKRKRFNDDDRLKNSFHRIKQKYSKCSCPDRHDDGHRCHQSNWPTTEQIISVMETEVKDRLVSMMRKREEVKREIVLAKNLKDIKTLSSDRESSATPPSLIMKPSTLSNLPSIKFSSIPALSPNFSSSSNSSTTMVEIPKVLSDTDSSKFDEQETSSSERSSKRKGGTPKRHDECPNTETIVAKKPKSLIGYILASKDRVSDTNVKGMVYANSMEELKLKNHKQYASPSLELYNTDSSDSSYNKVTATKQPSAFKYEHDDDSSKPSSSAFSIFGDKNDLKKAHKRRHDKRKKTKKQMKEKRKLDARCILKPHQLDQDKLRVLTSMGGLFYAGCLSAIQAPDIYAVTLDGERGNRPHIMSREEILRDAIMEVAPRTAAELPVGTRICAYWSQQYRCLYPGTVTAPSSPDSDAEGKFVNVEFDDGDNGRIAIDDMRFLLSNYPIVEYDADPLDRKGKQKRAPSTTLLEHDHILPACSNIFKATCVLNRNEVDAYREERKKLKKVHKEREREEERKHRKKYKCFDDDCKHNHKKHKKRRKHKKHHHLAKEELVDGHISPDDSVSQIGTFSQTPIKGAPEPKVLDTPTKDDTEEDNGSTVTESSGSLYQPKFLKKPSAQALSESSKIAAFLPARQLWTWSGKGFKRSTGRVKKQFFKSIQRGKETISVGDSAVFLSTGRPDRPYIGHIESMWETAANNMVVRVKWFYHPEETEGAPNMKYPGALFESPHEDENDVQTISHKCEVLSIEAYTNKFGNNPKKYKSIYDNNDTYYKAGFYDPTTVKIKMEEDIPVLAENEKWA